MKGLFVRIRAKVMGSFQIDQKGANFMLLMAALIALIPLVTALLLFLIDHFSKT